MSNLVRKLISVSIVLSVLFVMFAQQSLASDITQNNTALAQDGGNNLRTVNEMNGQTNYIGFAQGQRATTTSQSDAFSRFSSDYASEFGLQNPSQQLQFLSANVAPSGSTIYKYQQVHNGVPILGGEILIAVDSGNQLSAISGEVSAGLQIDTSPQIGQSAAQGFAQNAVATQANINVGSLQATSNGLAIYDPILLSSFDRGPASLVWVFEISAPNQPINYFILIDAQRGTLRLGFNQIHEIIPANRGAAGNLANTAPTTGTNIPLLPSFNGTAETYNSGSTPNQAQPGDLVCSSTQPNPPNALTGANACDTVSASPTIERNNAAHFFAFDVFDYFDAYHGRNSIDDAGMTIISNVDYRPGGTPYNNAFWDGTQMTYGDGDFFTADDVIGHEMAHGVTEFSSNLFYYYESGAINESYSDVFGEFIDQLNGIDSLGNPDAAPDRWFMGEDLGFGAIRYMEDPTAFSDPDSMTASEYYAPQGENNGFADNGGVHINSGVANKAAYLVVDGDTFNGITVSPLGATTNDSIILAGAIWYEAYNYMTSGSDYGVFYGALNTACNALIGQSIAGTAETLSAADCTEVNDALLAVEMNQPPVGDPTYAPQPALDCPNGGALVTLFEDDFEGGVGNFNGTALTDNAGVGPPYSGDTISFYGAPYSWSGTGSMFLTDSFLALDHYVEMTSDVTLNGGVEYYLHFQHAWGLEDYTAPIFPANGVNDTNMYDAAVLEYTTNGGGSWQDAGSLFHNGRDYNGTIPVGFGNPLEGRDAWGYDSHGFVVSWFDLTSLDGQDVNFRWRMTGDDAGPTKYFGLQAWDVGYFLDDVTIYSCGTPVVNPTPTPVPNPNPGPTVSDPGIAKSGTFGPGEVGLPGDVITWTITVSNPTGQVLTNIVVSDTLSSELRIDDATTTSGSVNVTGQTVTTTIPSLSPGQTVTIQIVTTVLGSPAGGVFVNTTSLTADGGLTASATASLSGVSGLPATGYAPTLRW